MTTRSRSRGGGVTGALCLLLAGLVLATVVHAGSVKVRAFLDRDQAQLGDTVTLNVEVDGTSHSAAPDVSALSSDFDILGRSHSRRVELVNGQRRVASLWAVQLRPRHAGKLVIPSLKVDGGRTQPLDLTVTKASHAGHGGPGDDVFIRVHPSTLTPYVGQQITLTVRLYYAPEVASGSLDMPHANGVDIRKLDKSSRYEAQRDGRIYRVLEKHFAVIAGRAGARRLAPITFDGRVVDSGSLADFFGQGGQPIHARSAPLKLDVRARPSAAAAGAWLPARKLSLKLSGLPSNGRMEAGQPLTLTLSAKAVGLPFESLPKLQLPKLTGVKVYPDRPHGSTNEHGPWLIGTRTRQFALVIEHPGEVTIPPISLSWWNVRTGKAQTARIPAHVLHVAAASAPATAISAAAAPAHGASAPLVSAAPAAGARQSPAKNSVASSRRAWPAVLGWLALALWGATVLAVGGWWWHRRRRRGASPGPARRTARREPARARHRAFLAAARADDIAAACDTLMAWARCERPELPHLGALAAALRPGAQAEAVTSLERARYAPDTPAPDADHLVAVFAKGFAWRREAHPRSAASALPPLYPD
jgi:hypothetical protein